MSTEKPVAFLLNNNAICHRKNYLSFLNTVSLIASVGYRPRMMVTKGTISPFLPCFLLHFARCGLSELSIQIIDCVKEGEDEALAILEGFWQNTLATFRANEGNINVRNEWSHYVGQQPIFF